MTGNEWTPVKDIMGNIRTLVDNNLDENWQSKSLSIYSRLIQIQFIRQDWNSNEK